MNKTNISNIYSIYNLTFSQLETYFESNKLNKAKAKITYKNLYQKRISDFDEISEFGAQTKNLLKSDFSLEGLTLLEKREDKDTMKLLFGLQNGNRIESVVMKHDYGNGICISTQIGCNMNCAFCESGKMKKIRNLEPFEMLLQILDTEKALGEKISHVVLMGIGEPFDNFENVAAFIEIINNPFGLDIGARHITVSTSGIIPKITEFTDKNIQANLAISLHAPNDEIRSQLMPINKAYPISKLIPEVKRYTEKTKRKVTFEYVMLKGINDREQCAVQLAELLKGIKCYVNLIPYNETDSKFRRTEQAEILSFYNILKQNNMWVTIRREFGSELKAACGQLSADFAKNTKKQD